MTITKEVLDELLSGVENADDLLGDKGLMKELKVRLMERMLGAELTEHLGYEPYEAKGRKSGNSRNGKRPKTVRTSSGETAIHVPRDRNGDFESTLLEKHKANSNEIENKVLAFYVWQGESTKGEWMSATINELNVVGGEEVYSITYFDGK